MAEFSNPLPGVPAVESPFREQIFASADAETQRIARDLANDGFAVFDFPDPDFDRVADAIKANLHGRYDWDFWHKSGHAVGAGLRLQDAWAFDSNVKRLACNQKIMDLLSLLYGRRAWPFQTLNFPVGTQQHYHTDSVHFSSIPERFMCGVWTALEDIDEDRGPLVYYPGSHKWPIYSNEHIGFCASGATTPLTQETFEPMWEALVARSGVQPRHFLPKKGQALIWAANLLHGGSRQNSAALTRWSQVTHYYFDDCAYYTPMLSDPFFGRIAFREMTDIVTGRPVPNKYVGKPIPEHFIAATRPRGAALPEGFDADLYYAANPDVKREGVPADVHWLNYGRDEGRPLRPPKPSLAFLKPWVRGIANRLK
jgi:phytanoyl-CoA dioxygenase PhyH